MPTDAINGLGDIDPTWAGDQNSLPKWFVDALAVPREEGFVEVDGISIHYFRWGQRGKPPVLMTHGFLAHARCFAFIAPFLAEDFDVVAYDLSAMGDSGVRANCDMTARGGEMIGVARALGLLDNGRKPFIVAHSFGASVALEALDQAPGLFAGAAICDMMTLRPAMLEAFWAGGHTSPGSGDPDKPLRIYPDFAAARDRFRLSPPPASRATLLNGLYGLSFVAPGGARLDLEVLTRRFQARQCAGRLAKHWPKTDQCPRAKSDHSRGG